MLLQTDGEQPLEIGRIIKGLVSTSITAYYFRHVIDVDSEGVMNIIIFLTELSEILSEEYGCSVEAK